MVQRIRAYWRRILPHGSLEQSGVLLWLIGVLVIGLRIALVVPDQPLFLRVLQGSTALLYGLGLALMVAAVAFAAISLIRQPIGERTQRGRHVVAARRDRWYRIASLGLLATDSLLAATIVHTATNWAVEATLSWRLLAQLGALGAAHVVLAVIHEHGANGLAGTASRPTR